MNGPEDKEDRKEHATLICAFDLLALSLAHNEVSIHASWINKWMSEWWQILKDDERKRKGWTAKMRRRNHGQGERIGAHAETEWSLMDRKTEEAKEKPWQECFPLGLLWTGGISIHSIAALHNCVLPMKI